jgi:hypothetical protein
VYHQGDELLEAAGPYKQYLRQAGDPQQRPRPICYCPGRDILVLPGSLPREVNNALHKIIAERSKLIGKVPLLVLNDCGFFYSWKRVKPVSRFWGLTAFHDLEEICCVGKCEKDEQYRNEIIEVLNEIFEMERNEPNLSSLCVQGIFQADSGITISLTGFLKLKSTKLLKRYKTIRHNHDLIFRP